MLGDGLCYPRRPAAHLVLFSIFGLFVEIAESNSFLRAAVTLFSRFLAKPTKSHVKALQGVFRYLTKTRAWNSVQQA
jgi:hypothetical protein